MSRILLSLTVALLAGGCLASAEQSDVPQTSAPPASSRTRVEVARLDQTEARLELTLPGEIEAVRDATLASALGGYVEQVSVSEGDNVRAGQVLVAIDHEIYAAQRDQAQAQLTLAQSEAARLDQLGDLATPSQREQAATQVAVASAVLRQARAQLARAWITAPFAGIVTGLNVERGEFAAPGAPVARVVSVDPVIVSLAVSDRDVVAIRPNAEVTVTTNASSALAKGRVRYISPAADQSTRAFVVEAEVPNPDHSLLPGMIARAHLREDLGSGIVIPQEWVITRFEDRGVFVEQDGTATWRAVELGQIVRDQVVIQSGLSQDDRVIMVGHRDLLDGDLVLVAREGVCCTQGRVVHGSSK